MLSEIRQSKTNTACYHLFLESKIKLHVLNNTENRLVFARVGSGRWGIGWRWSKVKNFQINKQTERCGCYWYLVGVGQVHVQHSTMHRQPLTTKSCPTSNIKAEKPCPRGKECSILWAVGSYTYVKIHWVIYWWWRHFVHFTGRSYISTKRINLKL